MAEYVIFGGTTEGREIAALMERHQKVAAVCVATSYGQSLLEASAHLEIHAGRMPLTDMMVFLEQQQPRLVIDATHPYADQVSSSIRTACDVMNLRYLRVTRPQTDLSGCMVFDHMDQLIAYLNQSSDIIFSTLGAKEAAALGAVQGYEARIWLRILPSMESLALCTDAGFPLSRLICMQGPFSEEINAAMLRHTGAQLLITKESGKAGGFTEKLAAAAKLGVTVAVLRRPGDVEGIPVADLEQRLTEGLL